MQRSASLDGQAELQSGSYGTQECTHWLPGMSSKFSEEDITVFLRRSGPEKAVGLPEARQVGWHSLAQFDQKTCTFFCFLQQTHITNKLGERNKVTLVSRSIDLFLECLK